MLRLATPRLVLRDMTTADAASLAAYRGDPDIARFQSWAVPFTVEDAERFIDEMTRLTWPVFGEWYQVAIDVGGTMIGDVGVNRTTDGREATIGYTVSAGRQGNGYATEAVGAIVDRLFSEGVQTIHASVDPANVPSARVLEQLGFSLESRTKVIVRGETVDDDHYVLAINRA